MKKNLLLMMLCCPAMLLAQNGNGVTVSNLAVDAGTVTFNVSWDKNNPDMPTLWSDTVWVFVDYNDAGVMKRLPVTDAAVSAGTVEKIPDNDKGVWVMGNARTNDSFSAKVELLTEIKDVGGACAYASNYPSVGECLSASEVSFTGTPEYKVVLERSNKSTYTVTVGKDESLLIPSSEVVLSFTDKTGAPGIIKCITPATYTLSGADVCAEANITLTLSGSQRGWRYQLYKDNIPVGSEKEGTDSALTFSEASATVGGYSYTVQTVDASGAQCEIAVSNVHAITVNPVPGAPTMSGAGTHCTGSANIMASAGTYGNGIKWDNNSTVSSRTVTVSGTYRAITTSAAGCTSSTATVVVTIGTPSASESAPNAACGCSSGLTACGGKCLNLPAGMGWCSNGLAAIHVDVWQQTVPGVDVSCPTGWWWASKAETDAALANAPSPPGAYWVWAADMCSSTTRWMFMNSSWACHPLTDGAAHLCVR